jgi:hypothetical protein
MIASRKTDAAGVRAAKGPKPPPQRPAEQGQSSPQPAAPEIARPVDVADGIPDRSAKPVKWVYVAIAVVFLAWMAFLVYCAVAGRG